MNRVRATGILGQVVADHSAADPLVVAAAEALVASGTPPALDGAIRKIDTSTDPDEIAGLAAILASASDPRVHQTLLYATEGNKAAQNPPTRAAAIRALANYPTHETIQLMQRLQGDEDAAVRDAAASVLTTLVTPSQ